ncbi:DUF6233 domain-containing protein [Streptomyces sp. NPDC005931]|uniref:DUF6233 domain-containing protein n=1 Tax=Streptomyces sp. NPDC005931 TaxID=3364737 RepID=UPI003693D78A
MKRARDGLPAPPDWVAAFGIGGGREPAEIHAGGCHMTGPRWRTVDRDEARRLLSSGVRACGHCQSDVQLHIFDLDRRGSPWWARAGPVELPP